MDNDIHVHGGFHYSKLSSSDIWLFAADEAVVWWNHVHSKVLNDANNMISLSTGSVAGGSQIKPWVIESRVTPEYSQELVGSDGQIFHSQSNVFFRTQPIATVRGRKWRPPKKLDIVPTLSIIISLL